MLRIKPFNKHIASLIVIELQLLSQNTICLNTSFYQNGRNRLTKISIFCNPPKQIFQTIICPSCELMLTTKIQIQNLCPGLARCPLLCANINCNALHHLSVMLLWRRHKCWSFRLVVRNFPPTYLQIQTK